MGRAPHMRTSCLVTDLPEAVCHRRPYPLSAGPPPALTVLARSSRTLNRFLPTCRRLCVVEDKGATVAERLTGLQAADPV